MYLKTILRQDIGFFDVETNTGEVVGRMSGDTVLIQDAMGEKVSIEISSIYCEKKEAYIYKYNDSICLKSFVIEYCR